MVTWWHLFETAPRDLKSDTLYMLGTVTAKNGSLGVFIFFAISGFVIPMAGVGGGRAIAYWPAIAKRMVRLYPPFLVSLFFAMVLMAAATYAPGFAGQAVTISARQILANALYLAPFVGDEWINPVFWTLLIEVQYYFVVYAVLRHIDGLSSRSILVGTGLAALIPLTLHSYSLIFDFTDCFAVGFLAFLITDGRVKPMPGFVTLCIAMLVVLFDKGMITMLLVGAAAYLCTVRGAAPKILVRLGTISYSLYLTHFFVATKAYRFFKRYLSANDGQIIASFALSLLACLVVASVFYYIVERPAIHWSHGISARRRATGSLGKPGKNAAVPK